MGGLCDYPDGWGGDSGVTLTECHSGVYLVMPITLISILLLFCSLRSKKDSLDRQVRRNAVAIRSRLKDTIATDGQYARMLDDEGDLSNDHNLQSMEQIAGDDSYSAVISTLRLIERKWFDDWSLVLQCLLLGLFSLLLILVFIYGSRRMSIWMLSWKWIVWVVILASYLFEKRLYLRYCAALFPSELLRWVWVIQLCESLYMLMVVEHGSLTRLAIVIISLSLTLALSMRALFKSPKLPLELELDPHTATIEQRSGLYSQVMFGWMTPLFKVGFQNELQMSDVTNILCPSDHTSELMESFKQAWKKRVNIREVLAEMKELARLRRTKSLASMRKVTVISSSSATNADADEKENELESRDETATKYQRKLIATIWEAFGKTLMYATPITLIKTAVYVSSPEILALFIQYSADFNDSSHARYMGYALSFTLFLMYMFNGLMLNIYWKITFDTAMRIRGALISACFEKALKLSLSAKTKKSTGEIMTMITVDIQKIRDVFPYLLFLVTGPFRVIVGIALLYPLIGWSVFVAVFLQLLLSGPIQVWVIGRSKGLQQQVQGVRDRRLDITNELFGSMKIIKMYGWEPSFGNKIARVREEELTVLRRYLWYELGNTMFFSLTSVMVVVTTFVTFTAAGHKLTPKKAFPALSLLSMITGPLTWIPRTFSRVVESGVSAKRIAEFLIAGELDESVIIRIDPAKLENDGFSSVISSSGIIDGLAGSHHRTFSAGSAESEGTKYGFDRNTMISISGDYSWDDDCSERALEGISVRFQKGSLSMIIGETGSGKSALISALLGEVNQVTGCIQYRKGISVAYSSQLAWIQNATLKENILFGHPLDSERYRKVIEVCALGSDLEMLADGDSTEIGEKGINLSGGQQQRVSLARAVYADCDVIVMDDPLSAVDSHVANHIFHECMLGYLKERGKTVILATHAVSFLKFADNVIVMNEGSVQMQGVLQDLIEADINLTKFVMSSKRKNNDANDSGSDDDNGDDDDEDFMTTEDDTVDGALIEDAVIDELPILFKRQSSVRSNASRRGSQSIASSRRTSIGSSRVTSRRNSQRVGSRRTSLIGKKKHNQQKSEENNKEERNDLNKNEDQKGKLIDEEERAVGDVDWKIFKIYLIAAGGVIIFVPLALAFILEQSAVSGAAFWLGFWSNKVKNHDPNASEMWYYLGIFVMIQCLSLLMDLLGNVIGLYLSLRASKKLHSSLLECVIHAPMSFFDTTPVGRLINRFAKDLYVVDSDLANSVKDMLSSVMSVMGAVLVAVIIAPIFAAVIIPFGLCFWWIQKYFIASSRALRRLSSLMNSPIYSHFNETIEGASIVRSFDMIDSFIEKNQSLIDADHRAYYANINANRWLQVRLQCLGNALILVAALCCVIARPSPGFVGVVIASLLNLAGTMTWTVRMKTQVEQDIVSVERLDQYVHIPQERAFNIEESEPAESWPSEGSISFKNVVMRYRPGLDPVLRGLSFEIEGRSKVGVIGRTGAGKSSILLTLLRLVEIDEGKILVDGLDISQLGLQQLRSKLSIIPQSASLFTGTLRFNLDPLEQSSDHCLIEALRMAHVWPALITLARQQSIRKAKEKEESEQGKQQEIELTDSKHTALLSDPDGSSSFMSDEVFMNSPHYEEMEPLQLQIEEHGSNLSVGQRQLICLARAIVRESQVLLLDEATSAVDPATDQMIQRTIREVFADRTVLTIAHRIDTILDYDHILIVDKGTVLEYDSPQNLLSNPQSRFSEIVQESFGVSLDEVIAMKEQFGQELKSTESVE